MLEHSRQKRKEICSWALGCSSAGGSGSLERMGGEIGVCWFVVWFLFAGFLFSLCGRVVFGSRCPWFLFLVIVVFGGAQGLRMSCDSVAFGWKNEEDGRAWE